jgi:outer membrane receptor for ferrienterochelin and colicins
MRSTIFALLTFLPVPPLVAQVPATGVVRLTVEESMGPIGDALVRVLSVTPAPAPVTTDAGGQARLSLPAGEVVLLVARIGYVPRRLRILVPGGGEIEVSVMLEMEMKMTEVEGITVSAARTGRLAGETPTRVEVISQMEVDEKTQMAPSGIAMQLSETPGVRIQSASPSLGTGGVRIFGLPGQYTAMLADGLPLYGGASSALGPLDISPVDLQRIEILKGPASALYGGQALGGVVNLISKPPTGRNEVLVNRRTLGVTDGATWLSRKFSNISGASLLVSGTLQGAEDVDHDGWGDQARARRWNVRPRFSRVDSTGRSLFVTAGFGYDDRAGGTFDAALAPDDLPFRERLTGRRADLGLAAKFPTSAGGNVAIRSALSTDGRDRWFGVGPVERDRISTGFIEVTRSTVSANSATVLGAAVQTDGYQNAMNNTFDHSWVTPGLFVTAERDVGPVTLSGSLRGDVHPVAGVRITERVAALVRPMEQWSLRASAGTGYAPATPLIEETEMIGLRTVRPGALLRHERSAGGTLDLNGKIGSIEILLTGYASRIRDAVQLAGAGDSTLDGVLVNSAGPTRIGGVEAGAIWRFQGGKLYLNYGFTEGTRTDPTTGVRGPVPLLPRHRVGADLMLERPGVYRIGLEGTLHGVQPLVDDPYRTRSKPYLYTMLLVMRQVGAFEVVANFENLLNVRQTRYEPLVLPAPMTGGRWTTDAWAPLEGFMANVAVRYRW